MKDRGMRELANSFLRDATKKLAELPFSELAAWPEWPSVPPVELAVPDQLQEYDFTVMKDAQSDGSVRIAIQRYRHYFWRIGEMTADGFYIDSGGKIRWFTEKDKWAVT